MLFLCEVDNLSFSIGLSEQTRARVEDAGCIELTSFEASALTRLKALHVPLIALGMVATLALFAREEHPGAFSMAPSFLAFLAGGIIEELLQWYNVPSITAKHAAVNIAQAFASCVIGFLALTMLAGSMK